MMLVLPFRHSIFIIDGEKFFRAELREPDAIEFSEAIGFTIYSNSRRSAESFKSVFELIWNERTLNEELKRAHKMQEEFINFAAHELRTPIQPILGISQMLRHKSNDTQSIEYLDIVIRNATRLKRLTEDILDVQKIDSRSFLLNKEKLELNELIANLVTEYQNQFQKEKKITIEFHRKPDVSKLIMVEADKNRLGQVIYNLLDNAVKFTNEGTVEVIIEEQVGRVTVSVKDPGKGIDVNIFPRLFSKFVTKSFQGTGLGLFICKGIIEAHGGQIWAKNNSYGQGATFSFDLPVYERPRK